MDFGNFKNNADFVQRHFNSKIEDRIGVFPAGLSQAVKEADDREQYSLRYCLRI